MLNYCKNKELKSVGLHIEGCYPDKCLLCQRSIIEPNQNPKKDKIVKNYDDRKLEYRNETILANHWKEIQK
ncbi:MAG: hypothetical protein PHO75_02375 [Candidatus Shapirobacteria bacterium]|nr:hypothetical protein [Candidatus Shapirobacteria bacterium]